MPVEPCHCDAENPQCMRMGMPMVGARWRLCHGVEVPVEKSESAREMWDKQTGRMNLPTIESAKAGTVVVIPPPSVDMPSLLGRAINFMVALGGHVADGMSRRSVKEIADIIETHCKPCQYFRTGMCVHKRCGCAVNHEKKFFNKLAWKSEHCPIKRW